MWVFLHEAWEAIKAALGVRRYLLLGWASGGAGFVAYWLLNIFGEKLAVFGSLLVGLLILVGSLAVFMTLYAMELRRELRPDLVLTCEDAHCVVEAPMRSYESGALFHETRAVHVRVMARTSGPKTVKQCTAGLLSVRQIDEAQDSQPYETIALPWSHKGHKPIDIGADDREYVDVLVVTQDDQTLTPCGSVPFRLGNIFSKPGTYEVRVAVKSSEAGKSVPYSFLVIWNGNWNEVTASPVLDPNG